MPTLSTSLPGPAANVWLHRVQASQPPTSSCSRSRSSLKHTRKRRCVAKATLTAAQDVATVLPYNSEHNNLEQASLATQGPYIPLPERIAHTATTNLVSVFAHPAIAADQQPDVLDILTQQLAEQHIPFCLPAPPLSAACIVGSSANNGHSMDPPAGQSLLDRYFQDVPVCLNCTEPACVSPFSHKKQPQAHSCTSLPSMSHEPATAYRRSISDRQQMSHQRLHELQHASQASVTNVSSPCTAGMLVQSQHQTPLPCVGAQLLHSDSTHAAPFSCLQETASAMLLKSNSCYPCITCQSAEVLRLRSSRGQTWKGLALRQAFMGRAIGQTDDEADVEDAAGGGGLLHGGAEDGGEGGGPSRGWGGAAGEDGDAEEDEDEDEDDEDEDQDDDESQDDSSSEGSQPDFDWWISSDTEGVWSVSGNAHGGFTTQGITSLPSNQQFTGSINVHSTCTQHLQFPLSRQQERTSHHHAQLNLNVHPVCQSDSLYGLCISTIDVVGAEAADKAFPQQQILPVITRCRTACRNKIQPLGTSFACQQENPLLHRHEHIKQRQSSNSAWKSFSDFAIRLCINMLGSCL